MGGDTLYSFCRICPASALQSTTPYIIENGIENLTTSSIVKLIITAFILIIAVFCNRMFCKVICPMGAILAPFNMISFWTMKKPASKCVNCKTCDKSCPVNGEPSKRIHKGVSADQAAECIMCYECTDVCLIRKKEEKKAQKAEPEKNNTNS